MNVSGPVYTIPDHLSIGFPFISDSVCIYMALCMNAIRSAPTIWYNSAPNQQVVQKWIRYDPKWRSNLCFKMLVKNTGLDLLHRNPYSAHFLPIEIELN